MTQTDNDALVRRTWAEISNAADTPTGKDDEDAFRVGVRDGFADAVQLIDLLTGGDGEYRYCTDHDPDRHCPSPVEMLDRILSALRSTPQPKPFQQRVDAWMDACFGETIKADHVERCDRFIEEALELAQTEPAFTKDRAHALVDYVFDRPQGEINQEVGGVMVTLAALCNTFGVDYAAAAETELARVWTKVEQIRAKQAAKPTGSALPVAQPKPLDPPAQDEVERVTSIIEGSLERHGVALRHCEGTRDDAIAAIAALDQHRGADAQVSSMCFAMEMAALRRNHSDEADALREENVRLREALRTAIGHIEHMAAWITKQGAGYSFESLGENMPDIRAALTGRQP